MHQLVYVNQSMNVLKLRAWIEITVVVRVSVNVVLLSESFGKWKNVQ